jgi:phosphopantetheinyl transferase
LRSIVGREAGLPPRDITFRYNSWGKPAISVSGQPSVDFNVSHTKGLSAIALARGADVGIDVEPFRPCPDRIRIAADVFGLEVAQQLLAVDSARQDAVFLGLWTANEAFIKARGSALNATNGRVPVRLAESGSECVVLRDDLLDRWSLTMLDLGAAFVGHVVVGACGRTRDGAVELRVAAGFGSK